MTKNWFLPALALSILAAASIGFGASHYWDGRAMETLTADRNTALDCRRSGATVAPCPVIYKNTRIVWRDKIETVSTPDRKQAGRIAQLSAALSHAQRTIRALARARMADRTRRMTVAYSVQNGSMNHPFNTYDRCPAGSVVLYDADFSARTAAVRTSGDPNVCYVRTRLYNIGRLALSSPHH